MMSKKKEVVTEKQVESNEAKFVRIVTPRVIKAIKSIRLIGNCTHSGYKWTEAMSEHIRQELQAELDLLDSKFAKKMDKQSAFGFDS